MPVLDTVGRNADRLKRAAENDLNEIGRNSKAVRRWIDQYTLPTTRATYTSHLKLFLRWLREMKKIGLTPDELVRDNLICVFKSQPEDAETKRKHTDWLSEYINVHLAERGLSDSKRMNVAATVAGFYKANDSPLFGNFRVSKNGGSTPTKIPRTEDIRKVLGALPLRIRAPFLLQWQSGTEIDKILSLRWEDLKKLDEEYPLKLAFNGRKSQRRSYFSFLGRDSIDTLKALRGDLKEGRVFRSLKDNDNPADLGWLNSRLKAMAVSLEKAGLIEEYPADSWRSHVFRHSFSTSCAEAGVKPEIREYWLGHTSGVAWVYQHPELHEGDYLEEYKRIEPYLSLNPDERELRRDLEKKEANLQALYLDAMKTLEKLRAALQASGALPQAHQTGS